MRAGLKLLEKPQEVAGQLIEQISAQIEQALVREDVDGRVVGREKHLFSIYQKMRAKRKSFSDIMDIFAFRIIVDSVDACYRALGVHSLYKPVPVNSKTTSPYPANGYQHCIQCFEVCTGSD